MKRAIIMIIDACGVGSMPDYKEYDEDCESNTLRSACQYAAQNNSTIQLKNLQKMGLANIVDLAGLAPIANPSASFGKMAELSKAKDTITGHWEMMGIQAAQAFPYYPEGFPDEVLNELKKQFNVKGILSNKPASGTVVIEEFGEEHSKTANPIIYTSADSVMQIACHVNVIPLETQYKWCELAREIMRAKHEVARIIARPFTDNPHYDPKDPKSKKYMRLNDKRHDYAVLPHTRSALDTILENNGEVLGLGKIQDIFAGQGIPQNIHTKDNNDGLDQFIKVLRKEHPKSLKADKQLIFLNLVETDCNYGHRRDPAGFAKALEEIDLRMPEVLDALNDDDLFFISADHGCDPSAPGSDHTREYVPLLMYNPRLASSDLAVRESFADIGATILDWFKLQDNQLGIAGRSCLPA